MEMDVDGAVKRQQWELERAVAAARGVPSPQPVESASHCAVCGAEIPEPRRRAAPGTRLCVGCKEVEEQCAASFAARMAV